MTTPFALAKALPSLVRFFDAVTARHLQCPNLAGQVLTAVETRAYPKSDFFGRSAVRFSDRAKFLITLIHPTVRHVRALDPAIQTCFD